MLTAMKAGWVLTAGVAGAAFLCPLCRGGAEPAAAQSAQGGAPVQDTATVRLHISGMTCGTCPTTARLALQRLLGVYSAKVTLDDSLGVVRYDPRKVTAAQIADHLARKTDYRATILPDSTKQSRTPGVD